MAKEVTVVPGGDQAAEQMFVALPDPGNEVLLVVNISRGLVKVTRVQNGSTLGGQVAVGG